MIRHELEYQISQSVCTEGSTKGILRRRAKRRRHSVEECEKGVDTTSARGRSSRGTTDDGESLSRIMGGKERNSHGCQTVLARRDTPASIKGLCPSMKPPQLCRGVTIFVVTKTTDYGDEGSLLTLTLSIERSEQLSTSFHSSLNMWIERNVGLRATGQVMRKTAVSLRLQMLASTMPSRTYSSHQLSW